MAHQIDDHSGLPSATQSLSSKLPDGSQSNSLQLLVTSQDIPSMPTAALKGVSSYLPTESHDNASQLPTASESGLSQSSSAPPCGSAADPYTTSTTPVLRAASSQTSCPVLVSVGCQTTDGPLTEQLSERVQQLAHRCGEQDQQLLQHRKLLARLHEQLTRSDTENARLQRHLQMLSALFEQLERRDREAAAEAAAEADSQEEQDGEPTVAPPEAELVERVDTARGRREVIHVSRTYLRLRDLILEKRSLLSEIDQLKSFNVQLERRLSRQELRLSSVAAELQTTWGLVSKLKMQHAQLHTTESVLRYELREKRRLLDRLRSELEGSRQRSVMAREMNAESELEWQRLRQELDQRKRELVRQGHVNTEEGFTGTPEEPASPIDAPAEDLASAVPTSSGSSREDTESPQVGSPSSSAGRLQELEGHCEQLYSRVVFTAARQAALQSRLSQLHERYGTSESGSLTSTDTAYASLDPQPTPSDTDEVQPTASDTELTEQSSSETDGMTPALLDTHETQQAGLERSRNHQIQLPAPEPQLEQHEIQQAREESALPDGPGPALVGSEASYSFEEGLGTLSTDVSEQTVSTGPLVDAVSVATLVEVAPVATPVEADNVRVSVAALRATLEAEAPLVSLPDHQMAIALALTHTQPGHVVSSVVAVTEPAAPPPLEPTDASQESSGSSGSGHEEEPSPALQDPESSSDTDDQAEYMDVRRAGVGRTAWVPDDHISRNTAELLEEVAAFLGRSRSNSEASPEQEEREESLHPTAAMELAESADSSDAEPEEAGGGGVSSAGCRLLSLLPERMVHMRHERQRLAERAAQQQQRAERLERRLARLRLLRREDGAARRALERRCKLLEQGASQQEVLQTASYVHQADEPPPCDSPSAAGDISSPEAQTNSLGTNVSPLDIVLTAASSPREDMDSDESHLGGGADGDSSRARDDGGGGATATAAGGLPETAQPFSLATAVAPSDENVTASPAADECSGAAAALRHGAAEEMRGATPAGSAETAPTPQSSEAVAGEEAPPPPQELEFRGAPPVATVSADSAVSAVVEAVGDRQLDAAADRAGSPHPGGVGASELANPVSGAGREAALADSPDVRERSPPSGAATDDFLLYADPKADFQRVVVERLLSRAALVASRGGRRGAAPASRPARCQLCQVRVSRHVISSQAVFRLFTATRHHCRVCARAFCRRCACVLIINNGRKSRVCVSCFFALSKGRAPTARESPERTARGDGRPGAPP